MHPQLDRRRTRTDQKQPLSQAIGCLYEADDHNLDISCGAVTVAAYSGNLALVTWLVENGQ